MEGEENNSVDPVIKAHITQLISALGGPDITDEKRPYVLGDEALACLRDLKKWIKMHDEEMDRWDIARAISETTLVTFDLIEILTAWEIDCESGKNSKMSDRIALASLELLVPLTWPLVLNKESKNNHYRHAPYLNQARLKYKRAILSHPKNKMLRAIIRLAIPVLKLDKQDRTKRDDGILKLVLFFFRNILAIEAEGKDRELVEEDISRSSTIQKYDEQNVVQFLVTISAQIGTLFTEHEVAVMECMFYLLRGLTPESLFPIPESKDKEEEREQQKAPEPSHKPSTTDLKDILRAEKGMKSAARKNSHRHSRFGTMISMVNPDGSRYAVSGVEGVLGADSGWSKIDANKKWSKPGGRRIDKYELAWNQKVPLSRDSNAIVKTFVSKVLSSGFNLICKAVRRLIQNDNERATIENQMQFLYVVAFFLESERQQHEIEKIETGKESDYGLVAESLNQEMFIVVMKLMRECSEKGPTQNMGVVYASMACFLQILLVVNEMSRSNGSTEDQEIAENMKERLFYEEAYLSLLASLPRLAVRQSQVFLTKCVELTHVLLKMLEVYTKQHTEVYVRSKRQKKKDEDATDEYEEGFDEEKGAKHVTTERKFVFAKFERKFINSETLSAYKRYLSVYNELSSKELMHGLWFIHRLFSNHPDTRAHFFSLDFMRLLQRLCDDKTGVSKAFKVRKEIDRFMSYYVDKLRKALEKTPSLYVELLFNKMNETVFYLEHGHDPVRANKKSQPTVAQTWEFTEGMFTDEQKHGIAIATLIDDGKSELVEWLIDAMQKIVDKREAGTVEDEKLINDDKDKINHTKRDGKFRLLLTTLGWTVPQSMTEDTIMSRYVEMERLELGLQYLKKYLFEPFEIPDTTLNENNNNTASSAGDLLRREPRAASKPKKTTRKRKQKKRLEQDEDGDINMINDQDEKPRKKKTRKIELQKHFKSADFIGSDDDLSDEERDKDFFERESKLREKIDHSMKTGADIIPNSKEDEFWSRPVDDDKVPEIEEATQENKENENEDSLFVGGDGPSEDEEIIQPHKRVKRSIAIDSDDDDEE